jgi:FtsH-binding integral membrane protein
MRKYTFHALSMFLNVVVFALMLPVAAYADGGGNWEGNPIPDSPIDSVQGVLDLASKVVRVTYQVFFMAAVFFILLAAYTYLSAKDNAKQVEKATKSLINAAIAIAVALVASGAASLINNALRQ